MRLLKTALALLCLVWLAGCSFQSKVILPDPKASGDPVAGFPADAPFRLEAFDIEKGAYSLLGTAVPEKAEGGRMRYVFTFADGEDKKLLLQAQTLSENNYVLRYAQTTDGVEVNAEESALLFMTVADGTYYILTNVSGPEKVEKIFAGTVAPQRLRDSTLVFDTEAQARRMSDYFRDHREDFRSDSDQSDYVRIRLMP